MSAFQEVLPVGSRPSSRVHRDSALSERSQHISLPIYHPYKQRESKHLSILSAKTLSPISPISRDSSRILFYHSHDPYYGFTNFSNHPVVYKGKKYPTSEHLFQSFKFQDHKPDLAEHIRTCSERPSVAFSEARRFQPEVRPDWKEINIAMMDLVLQLKFEQHDDLREELLGTGNASLFEDSDKDAFWGVGADQKGRNELGKALERLRTKLRASDYGVMSPTHKAQPTFTSLASNGPQKTESLVQRVHPPGHNVNIQSLTLHSTQLSSNRITRFHVQPAHALTQTTVQSPTHTSPHPVHNVQLPSYVGQTPVPPARPAVQTTQSLTQKGKDPAQNAHLTMQIQSPILKVQLPEQNRPLTEQNAESTNDSPKSLDYDSIEAAPADLAVKCRIPDCEKPVYYDGTVKSDYCSQQHRQEAVIRGLAVACIKCLKMPQSETNFFCGQGCRDESLNKVRSKS